MKRIWLLTLLLAGSLVALNCPAFAKDDAMATDDSSSVLMEDVNSAIGGLTNRIANVEKQQGLQIEVHGFAETDIINDSTQSFTETVGNSGVKQPASYVGDNGWTLFSLRNSRIDFLAQTAVDGWKTKGYIEGDFFGYDPGPGFAATANPLATITTGTTIVGGVTYVAPPVKTTTSNNNLATNNNEYKFFTQPTLRLRHAYLDAQKDGWDFLVGQYWTLFGWNMDYVLATVSDQPVMGTLYERIPQARVMKTLDPISDLKIQLAVDAEMPMEIISDMPNLNGGIRFLFPTWQGRFTYATGAPHLQPASLGFSITNRNYAFTTNTDPNTGLPNSTLYNYANEWGSAAAIDAFIPVVPSTDSKDNVSVALTGEWTYGAGDVDGFNGGGFGGLAGIAQSTGNGNYTANLDPDVAFIDGTGGLQLLLLESMTGQMQIQLPANIGTIVTLGYGEIYSPNIGQAVGSGFATAKSTYNDDSNLFVNVMQDMTPSIRLAIEYARFDTHYLANGTGNGSDPTCDMLDQRLMFASWYRF